MSCEHKTVFPFYSPPSPKLLAFPARLLKKLLKEKILSPLRIIYCWAKNNTETFQPVWLFPKVTNISAQGFVMDTCLRHSIRFASFWTNFITKGFASLLLLASSSSFPKWGPILISKENRSSSGEFQRGMAETRTQRNWNSGSWSGETGDFAGLRSKGLCQR